MGKTSALTNLLLLVGPAILSLLLWVIFTIVGGIGLLGSSLLAVFCAVSGLALLVAAKVPLFAEGRRFNFGPGGLSERGCALYFAGWSLVGLSALLSFGLYFAQVQA